MLTLLKSCWQSQRRLPGQVDTYSRPQQDTIKLSWYQKKGRQLESCVSDPILVTGSKEDEGGCAQSTAAVEIAGTGKGDKEDHGWGRTWAYKLRNEYEMHRHLRVKGRSLQKARSLGMTMNWLTSKACCLLQPMLIWCLQILKSPALASSLLLYQG